MKMTRVRPAVPGWYWYELPGSWALQPVLVFDGGTEVGLMYTLEGIDAHSRDCVREGLVLEMSSDDARWSDEPIFPPRGLAAWSGLRLGDGENS